ncbi:MAG: DUF4920 domain-containing protein [Maribacter sp.]|nr:DUF4920 domain-containing protein [Maribacter sp.]
MPNFTGVIQILGNMKSFNVLLVFFVLISVCNGQEPDKESVVSVDGPQELMAFGDEIDFEGSVSSQMMAIKYNSMTITDTVHAKFTGIVTNVCQAKGCWMKVQLGDGHEAMVRFKEYGFFVPKDIKGRQVVVNGWAFVEEMGIEDQKHFAKDAGKSEEEIAKIDQSKRSYGFEANGVLLKE